MNDFFSRHGPEPYRPRPPSSFRDCLADLRDAVREGLADAASRAVGQTVRRAAARILGEEEKVHGRRHEVIDAGWGREYEDDGHGDGWGDGPWHGGWGGREDQEREDPAEAPQKGHGGWRLVAAACCQAATSVVRAVSPGKPLSSLACAVLSGLALILGGGLFACEAGLSLAEAAWAVAEALAARRPSDC
jgi:hypothetical protein